MVDTVKGYLNQKALDQYDDYLESKMKEKGISENRNPVYYEIQDFMPELSKDRVKSNKRVENGTYEDFIDDFRFKYYFYYGKLTRISFIGSFPRLIHVTNYKRTDLTTISQAILRLKKKTGLPIERFKVTRLDLGFNIIVDSPVSAYINIIDHLERHERIRIKNKFKIKKTTYEYQRFQNNSNVLVIYDKVKNIENDLKKVIKLREQLERRQEIEFFTKRVKENELKFLDKKIKGYHSSLNILKLKGICTRNNPNSKKGLLRLEIRYYRDLKNKFPDYFPVLKLREVDLYKSYSDHLYENFLKVKYIPRLYFEGTLKPTDVRDYFLLKGLYEHGDYEKLEQALKQTNLMGKLTSAYKSAIKRYFNAALTNPVVCKRTKLEKELREKVLTATENAKELFRDYPWEI